MTKNTAHFEGHGQTYNTSQNGELPLTNKPGTAPDMFSQNPIPYDLHSPAHTRIYGTIR